MQQTPEQQKAFRNHVNAAAAYQAFGVTSWLMFLVLFARQTDKLGAANAFRENAILFYAMVPMAVFQFFIARSRVQHHTHAMLAKFTAPPSTDPLPQPPQPATP